MDTIVSGIRPTGSLHLGNYAGAVATWVDMQATDRCFFFVADYHMLTSGYLDVSALRETNAIVLSELLAMGVDPSRATVFVQSDVPAHAELSLLLSMVTPLSWLERCPTYKDLLQNLSQVELRNAGFLNYPVTMAADILMYRASVVPVGQDQSAHLEIAREILRRFNHLYTPLFVEPKARFATPFLLRGLDGRKMSKSYGNTIRFQDTPEQVREKVRMAVTDPARIRRTDPGHPEVCAVFDMHALFNKAEARDIRERCMSGSIGCVACKQRMADVLDGVHGPIHERSQAWLERPQALKEIASEGAKVARHVASAMMADVHEAMGLGL